jgi:hypothetical protein
MYKSWSKYCVACARKEPTGAGLQTGDGLAGATVLVTVASVLAVTETVRVPVVAVVAVARTVSVSVVEVVKRIDDVTV